MTAPTQERVRFASAMHFGIEVDGVAVGLWSQCEGLSAEYEIEEYREGGGNDFVHRLPGRLSHTPLRLTRVVDSDSGLLAAWFSSVHQRATFGTGKVTLRSGDGRPVASWQLSGVWPSRYSGPVMSADGGGLATETLELVHHGFVQGRT